MSREQRSSAGAPERLLVRTPAGRIAMAPGEAAAVGAEVGDTLRGVTGGTVHLDGRDVSSWSVVRRISAGLVVLGQVEVAAEVSVHDHLAAVPGSRADRVAEVLATAPLLAGRGGDPAGWLSGGERQILGWLQASLLEPRVILLDGAGRGLDPSSLEWAGGVVRSWLEGGTVVLVVPGRPEEQAWAAPAA